MSLLDRIVRKKKGTSAAATAGQLPVEKNEAPAKDKKLTVPAVLGTTKKTLSDLAVKTILAPVVTEKSAHLADQGVYVFSVPMTANRVAVRQAFREIYGVQPSKVNIVVSHGKETRFGQTYSRQADRKKALVSVPKGTRVSVFEK